MRGIVLAAVAIQLGLALPALAENTPDSERPINELLPLFERNHCAAFRDATEQLFCGDPDLNDAAAKLNVAIEENAEWIRDRNSSCGVFANQRLSSRNVQPIKACLLSETEERTEILTD